MEKLIVVANRFPPRQSARTIMPLRFLHLILLALILLPATPRAATTNDILARATAALAAATPHAQADPTRPLFHVISPAQWMNDPNGPIYFKGWYHLFYQLDPYSDRGGPKYWGHVRSRDLVKWEPLPIALWPSQEKNETEIWSGCCTVNGLGQPMIFYTSVARGQPADIHAEQWAATSDDPGLLTWQKSPANPILTEALNGGRKVYDWRDPFVFHFKNRTFLVTGGNLNHGSGGQAAVNLYEAQNPALTQWTYRGVLFQDTNAPTAECPNFFQLGGQWVLFLSPYGQVHYFIGDFNPDTCRFQPRTHGLLDHASGFYAPNTMLVPDGRRIVWGWVTGFPGGLGWNGCLSLPRLLSLTRDDQLRQTPAPQLQKLRGPRVQWRNLPLNDAVTSLPLPDTNTLEIQATLHLNTATHLELRFASDAAAATPIEIGYNGTELTVLDARSPLTQPPGAPPLTLRVFFDRSVLEIFANDTVCFTKVITPLGNHPRLELRATGGAARADRVQAWPMKTIW